ncbi:hypothetical protein CKA32_004029 [Geitlerinema sp. FC II]|nr:hypothetical protein CKA32_006253 [Geitlerinema sp. FC II]PPT10119.1 hypothetical protein CKA32_004029 [Geitlerinema sp. FC II]
MCRNLKGEILMYFVDSGVGLPIAPSSFPGLPIFLRRCGFRNL